MNFVIRLAEVNIKVRTIYNNFFINFGDYIYHLNPEEEPDIDIVLNHSDILKEKDLSMKTVGNNNFGFSISDKQIESQVVYRKIADHIPAFNALLMHGVVLDTDNQGYMLLGASGVGKTTRANLWKSEYKNTKIINGDKPIIRVGNNEILAYGTPWCGKENYNVNESTRLKAIILLERTETKSENRMVELSFSEAFPFIFNQTYHPKDRTAMHYTLELLKGLEGKVSFYKFISFLSHDSIRLAYETIRTK